MGTDWAALGNLVTSFMPLVSKPGSGPSNYGRQQNDAFQNQQIQNAINEELKKQKKAEKGKLFGSIGSTIGAIGGAALAPLTGGASLAIPAALGAAGSAVGGAAGEAIGGGSVNPRNLIGYGLQGAGSGLMTGIGTGFGATTKPYVDAGLLDTTISGSAARTAGPTVGGMWGYGVGQQFPAMSGASLLRPSGPSPTTFGGGMKASGSWWRHPQTGDHYYQPQRPDYYPPQGFDGDYDGGM